MNVLLGLVNRLKEPSSWAALSILWVAFVPHLPFEPFANAGAAICALIAFLMKEKSTPKNPPLPKPDV